MYAVAHLELGLVVEEELVEPFFFLFTYIDSTFQIKNNFYMSFISLNLLMADRTEAAAVVE